MASGKITNKNTLSGVISSGNNLKTAAIAGGSGTTDHSRLINRSEPDQHPIEAITDLREELDSKLNSETALPLINEALQSKAKGLYFDALKELARKSYWYLTAEIDPKTGLGTKESIISGPYDLGMGGGSGGGGGVTTVTVTQVNWPAAVPVGNPDHPAEVTINWTSTIGEDKSPTGEGTIYLIVNNKQVETRPKQKQGVVKFDISRYVISGDNTIQIKVLDMYGTTGVTVGTVTGVSLELKSTFNRDTAWYGKVDFTYTPIGNVTKKVYFIIDGNEENAPYEIVQSSNELQTYTIYGLSHGAHTLKVYFEADVAGAIIPSNTLFYDIIFVEEKNPTPIIASEFNKFQQEQYISFNIPYRVFIDGRNAATVTLKANGEIIRTSEVTTNGTHTWAYRVDTYTVDAYGKVVADPIVLEIICGDATKRFEVAVVESQITVTPILNNLELALSANGKSNDDLENREVWSYTTTPPPGSTEEPQTYAGIFTNFNWKSDGWVLDKVDEAGNPTVDSATVLRVSGDARVAIPLELFATNFTAQGKTIELEFATHGIRNYESTIISCLDNEKTPFYTVEPLYIKEEERRDGYEISYIYSILSETITTIGKHLFVFDGTSWTLESKDENNQTTTTIVNLNDYGISLTETRLNPEGDNLGTVIKGDRILVNFSMEARGMEVTPQVASIRSQQSFLSTQYKEDEHVRVTFVVEPSDADHNRIIWMYINGIASGAMQYPMGESFQQKSPNYITIGSSEAIVDIYNIRVYNSALTNRQVVNNWIADTSDASLKASRFNHNQVLNEQDQLTPESLFIGAPDLPYMIWDIDPLPEYKGDKRLGRGRYVDPTDSTRNFTVDDGEYNVQGTSSSVYPVKNIRLRNRSKNGAGYAWYDDDGNTINKWPITPDGIGVNYYTFKVDYASSEGANNVELTKLYNDASLKYGLLTPPQQKNSNVRVGIDGFPIVAFHQDKNDNITFCTKANFNNDKANEDVYGFDGKWNDSKTKDLWLGDESWETTNNSAAETKYQKPVTVENFAKGFEIRFPDEDGYNKMDKLGPMTAWIYSTYREEVPVEEEKAVELPNPVTFTYEESVQSEGGSFSTSKVTKTFTHDTKAYRLAKFKAELKDWFNVDSCLFYYLYTELFLMIDSRAKNAFPTYFATRTNELVVDDDGNEIPNTYTDGGNRWYWIPYDMDTAIGIDNKGKLTFDYYLEDIDQLDGADVYNGQTSVMWCNIRDAFKSELAAMYAKLRIDKLISFEEVEKRFKEHQGKWPEVVLNLDAHNKYVVPLKNGDNYLEMLQGTKEQQRKWWLYNRFKYIDSKYNGGDAVKDFLQFRAYVDIGKEKPNLEITPYANIYATASFGNGAEHLVSKRVLTRGESITLENTFRTEDDENDQETYIYSASQLKSIGDISPFHPDTVKIGNAVRLQDLKVGDASPDYKNPYLKELTVGANTLLRTIDARNCVNLGTGTTVAPDLSQCTNIEEIYFTGTKIKGITLPDGGTIKKLHLPGTLVELKIQNHPLLEDLKIENTNTTITRSATNKDGYTITGVVVKKDRWNETNANGNLYLADSLEEGAPQIRVSVADKAGIYDVVTAGESKLTVKCAYVDARYDLLNDTEVQLAEYSTRLINNIFITTATPTVTAVLGTVTDIIIPPAVADFKTSLIETLWLEGIPSKAIKAREFIQNMQPGTRVRLININETYDSWEEIKQFYDLLDRHYGINFNNTTVEPKAQVTGVININTISYRDYAILTARYPEVTIYAKQIISTVTFYNDRKAYHATNIALDTALDSAKKLIIYGKSIVPPADPTKESTQAYYYTFTHWNAKKAIYTIEGDCEYETLGETLSPEYLVVADTRIDAVYVEDLQDYSVTFDTDSEIISIDETHQNLVVKYGSTITAPETLNVPEAVTLAGWYLPTGEQWVFEGDSASRVLDNTVLKASWIDENEPTVSIARYAYNKFSYEAFDNLGIVGWAVVKDSDLVPSSWTAIKSTTHLSGIYEIASAGEYHFWITDANGNTATQKIVAYPVKVSILEADGCIPPHKYTFTEGENTFVTNFALNGSILIFMLDPDPHYENLIVNIDAMLADSLDTFIVSQDVNITIACTPKDYMVTFVTSKESEDVRVESQLITYNHKVEKPLAVYHAGHIISSWSTANGDLWDFKNDVVESELTLYANWEEYHTPTTINISIPFDPNSIKEAYYPNYDLDKNDPYTINIWYKQNKAYTVRIDLGDGHEVTDPRQGTLIQVKHTYAKAGNYDIKIYGTASGYEIGGGQYYRQAVVPASCVNSVDFAWDLTSTREYAFMGANISELNITPYMTSISLAAFASCQRLTSLSIPKNIVRIDNQAFEGCTALAGTVTIPKTVAFAGDNVFASCTNLEEIIFEENGLVTTIGSQFARKSGIKRLIVPRHITHIGEAAFSMCDSLTKVVFMNPSLTTSAQIFNSSDLLFKAGPISYDEQGNWIPNDDYDIEFAWTEKIPDNAFSYSTIYSTQTVLKEVVLPDSIKTIGDGAFKGTWALRSIQLPTGLTTIGADAFYSSGLTRITVPLNVTSIGSRAFGFCASMVEATLNSLSSVPPVLFQGDGWFLGCNSSLRPRIPKELWGTDNYHKLVANYGDYWNVYRYDATNGNYETLGYDPIS